MAPRSAVRTGWFTLAVMLKMADAMWMRLVRAATNAKNTSGDDMWEYWCKKWCSDDQTYLKPNSSHLTDSSRFCCSRCCS